MKSLLFSLLCGVVAGVFVQKYAVAVADYLAVVYGRIVGRAVKYNTQYASTAVALLACAVAYIALSVLFL